jgi:DNA-binding NarL/FixJ family response regulator
VIADDHPVVREGLSALLNAAPDLQIIGEAGDGAAAVAACRRLLPDVALIDLQMPQVDGLAAIRILSTELPQIHILVLTTFDSDAYVQEALRAGALGYVLKDLPGERLVEAVRTVSRGQALLQPEVATLVVRALQQQQAPAPLMSERELAVLRLLARGDRNKEIAGKLYLSESTVKTHIAAVFQKLGVNDRTSAVTVALQKGLITL